jgi:hypothetical protein
MPVPADPSVVHAPETAVRDALREMTANLLRVMRGTGRPEDVVQHAQAFTACCAAYREIVGRDPAPAALAQALRLSAAPGADTNGDGENWSEWDRAVREMVHGGLQVAAAELLAQHAQAAAGRRELFSGYRDIEKIHSRQLSRLLRRGAS